MECCLLPFYAPFPILPLARPWLLYRPCHHHHGHHPRLYHHRLFFIVITTIFTCPFNLTAPLFSDFSSPILYSPSHSFIISRFCSVALEAEDSLATRLQSRKRKWLLGGEDTCRTGRRLRRNDEHLPQRKKIIPLECIDTIQGINKVLQRRLKYLSGIQNDEKIRKQENN